VVPASEQDVGGHGQTSLQIRALLGDVPEGGRVSRRPSFPWQELLRRGAIPEAILHMTKRMDRNTPHVIATLCPCAVHRAESPCVPNIGLGRSLRARLAYNASAPRQSRSLTSELADAEKPQQGAPPLGASPGASEQATPFG